MTGRELLPLTLIGIALIQQGQPPTFRSDTAIVPVDVRVLDSAGNPVTDLTRADFAIKEDGVPQSITQFHKQSTDASIPSRRTFAIVLGNGRIQTPFKAIDALIDFIGQLGPDDSVGVSAYNRWAPFSADHAATVALLERYKSANAAIQTALETAAPPVYVSSPTEITTALQAMIDALFVTDREQTPVEFAPPSRRVQQGSRFTDARFDDVLRVYGAIDYLTFTEGERHVVLITEQGTGIVMPDSGRSRLAMTAADGRVTLHIIQTGGFGDKQSILPPDLLIDTHGKMQRLGIVGVPAVPASHRRDAREVTAQTGGLSFYYTQPRAALEHLQRALRVDYLLGYVPANTAWDGRYRQIEVTVNRSGVTSSYRRGYHASHAQPVWEDRATLTDIRLTAAREAKRPPRGLLLKASAKRLGTDALDVEVQVEPSQVAFAIEKGQHVASLEVAIWVTNIAGQTIGSITDHIDLRLSDQSYASLARSNVAYSRRMTLTGTPAELRAAVYDYDNDRVGAVSARVR